MVNQELLDYIRKEEFRGHSAKQLRAFLIQGGWPPAEVDEAINSTNFGAVYPRERIQEPSMQLQAQQPMQSTSPIVNKRPTGVTVIAILYFIFGGLGFLWSIYLLIMGGQVLESVPLIGGIIGSAVMILSIVGIIINILTIFVGLGLWYLKNWARTIALIFSIISLLAIPIGTAVGIIFLVILTKQATKDAFRK